MRRLNPSSIQGGALVSMIVLGTFGLLAAAPESPPKIITGKAALVDYAGESRESSAG